MLEHLYNEFLKLDLTYHELGALAGNTICIMGKSLDPEGVDEVMRMNKIADKLYLGMKWDGQNIEIVKQKQRNR